MFESSVLSLNDERRFTRNQQRTFNQPPNLADTKKGEAVYEVFSTTTAEAA